MSVIVAQHRDVTLRAMGSTAHLIAVGDPNRCGLALRRAAQLLAELEQRWSRFLADSEVSRLNTATSPGPITVSRDTAELISLAVDGWRRTGGLFDPTMLHALIDAGYDRDLDAVVEGSCGAEASMAPVVYLPTAADRGCDRFVVDLDGCTVTRPVGVGFDPGGLGKGRAADLLCAVAMTEGIDGFMANVGGDLAAVGSAPDGAAGWAIGIPNGVVDIAAGGVATSTCLKRRWLSADGSNHHLIDTATGKPSPTAAHSVTVLAATACDAEILATALAAHGGLPDDAGVAAAMLGSAAAIITRHDGSRQEYGPVNRYVRSTS